MRAVLVEVPRSLLDERRRCGADRWDELWEGELHMVPPPMTRHNRIGSLLIELLSPPARRLHLTTTYETGVWASADTPESYRIPDVSVVDRSRVSERGIESTPGTLLAFEIRSPEDEAYLKLPFYGRVGVTELVVLDLPDSVIRRYTGDGAVLTEVTPAAGARSVDLATLPGVSLTLVDDEPGLLVEVP